MKILGCPFLEGAAVVDVWLATAAISPAIMHAMCKCPIATPDTCPAACRLQLEGCATGWLLQCLQAAAGGGCGGAGGARLRLADRIICTVL